MKQELKPEVGWWTIAKTRDITRNTLGTKWELGEEAGAGRTMKLYVPWVENDSFHQSTARSRIVLDGVLDESLTRTAICVERAHGEAV